VRDQQAHRATFNVTPAYLASFDRGIAAGGFPFAERGVQLSRGFRALKVWMSFKTHGLDAFTQLIHQNVRQAHYLAGLVTKHPRLALLAPAPLNVVCFRFVVPGVDDSGLNALNKEILLRIQESGLAIPSQTMLDGKFARMPGVVGEGRRVIANVERVANLFVTKTVYAMLLAIAIGIVRWPYPFLPRHLTIVSSLTIGIPAFFLLRRHAGQPTFESRRGRPNLIAPWPLVGRCSLHPASHVW